MGNSTPSKIGYRYGLVMFVFGVLMVGINAALIYFSNTYYPKILCIGIAISVMSLIFFVFPGGIPVQKADGKDLNKELWNNAPTLHKVMWVVWGILAIALAVIVLFKFDPSYFK